MCLVVPKRCVYLQCCYPRSRLFEASLYEGFGLPLVEAMSRGVPVLTSNTASMPEVAGQAACLVDPVDQNSIQQGLEKMLLDSEYRARLAKYAKPQAAQFNWSRSAELLYQVFEKVVL